MKCELCNDDDINYIIPQVHFCNVCKKWLCEFCIYNNTDHPHKEED